MLKRILRLMKKDLIYSIRESVLIYSIVGMLLLVVGVRFFLLTAVGEQLIVIAVDETVSTQFVEQLKDYAKLEYFADVVQLKERVLERDDVSGIHFDGVDYVVISEGNEDAFTREWPRIFINNILYGSNRTELSIISLEREAFPFVGYLALFMLIGLYQTGGLFIGLSIVDDRQSGSIKALIITPIRTIDYIIGKSILGSVVVVVLSLATTTILLGPSAINYPILTISIIASLGITIFVGFLVGLISKNYVTANALYKPIGTCVTLIPAIALFIPDKLKYLLYIFPNYWTFEVFFRMFIKTELPNVSVIVLTAVFSIVTVAVLVVWAGRKLRFTIS